MTNTRHASDVDRPVALITGSTSGIGAAVARRLVRDGYAVILHSRASVDVGLAMARELGHAVYLQADLADDGDRDRLVKEAVATWGRLDVLVNNAGISRVIPHGDLAAATPDIWHELYEVNVVAPFRLVSAAEAALRAAAGRGRPASVVNISSHAGVRPKGASIPYAATKAALNHVTKLLATTLAPDIRVNAVAPGPGRYAVDGRLDRCTALVEGTFAHAAGGQPGGYRAGGGNAGGGGLSDGGSGSFRWWTEPMLIPPFHKRRT